MIVDCGGESGILALWTVPERDWERLLPRGCRADDDGGPLMLTGTLYDASEEKGSGNEASWRASSGQHNESRQI